MTSYPPEVKAQVIADRLLGMSLAQLAKKYEVPKATVQHWVNDRPVSRVEIPQKDDLGALVYEYLSTGLQALIAQARAMGDPEWFKRQGPTAHYIHGTLADKLVIVLGGIERGAASASADGSTTGDERPTARVDN